MSSEPIQCIPWRRGLPPRRILAIRLQAMGDVVITLPYLQSLRNHLPGTYIDFLTRKEVDDIPRNLKLFRRVFSLGGGRNFKKQNLSALLKLPILWRQHYDAVIDLQNNPLSRWVRKALHPPAWSEFDRFSPIPAGERTRLTIEALGLGAVAISPLVLKNETPGMELLAAQGWKTGQPLVVLNPAGFFPTRNWPLDNYVHFARLWLERESAMTRFLVLGTATLQKRIHYLKQELGDALIDLAGKTTPAEAFSILKRVTLVLTEDSGLMHMAWVAGAPTVALFGSSRSDWSAPPGERSLCLHSADLLCGQCMEPECRFGDVHCLTRYTPQLVFEKAITLIRQKQLVGGGR